MELYIGGTAQGKKVYVTQVRGIAEARIWDNFEEWFREKLQESASKSPSPEAESMAYLEKHPDTVIICDEVGSGIVPLDSFEREYRERLGRLLCEIAAKAEGWNGLYVELDRESNRTVSNPAWNDAGKCRTPVYWQTDG